MKCWASIQLVTESWATNKLKAGKRADEEAELQHQATCGSILLEQRREIMAYQEWKQFKVLPEPKPIPQQPETKPDTQAENK